MDSTTLIEELVHRLTVEEKVQLLSGVDMWHTAPVPRLGIGAIKVRDLSSCKGA